MAEWLRWLISLSPLTIRSSHRCDWCGFEPPHGSQVGQVKFYLRVCQVVFPGVLPFSPHLLIGSSRYEWIILKGTLNWTKKKKKVYINRVPGLTLTLYYDKVWKNFFFFFLLLYSRVSEKKFTSLHMNFRGQGHLVTFPKVIWLGKFFKSILKKK